ncbi:MAG: hypothetical protein OXF11_15655 [Deltaproteobacteria bacterium]|nr:hypothetical protein [Deltaproteobacteria bacterium]
MTLTKTLDHISRFSTLVLVLGFGVPFAEAEESTVWQAFDRPGVSLLSGLQGCAPALRDGTSEGSRCLAGWSVNDLLLDAITRLATERGQGIFGKHFRVVNNLSYSPVGSGLRGGLDVVLPFGSSTSPGTARHESSAFFLQNGVTRWVDDRGSSRNDYRVGAVRRFGLSGQGAVSGILGVSAFVQQSREYQHTRMVAGADYRGKWGQGTINMFVPTTGWRPTYTGHKERALAGGELALQFNVTTTLSMKTALARWADDDGLGGWSTKGRVAVEWRPHRWFNMGAAWNGVGTDDDAHEFRLAFSMPLGDMRKPPQWEGVGVVGGGPTPSSTDPWSPVENVGAIQVATRESTGDDLASQATVRFLHDSAMTGDRVGLEVRLPAATSSDLNLIVTLAPGKGPNPAVPGVDYVDEPIPVTIAAGTSSATVTIQLPLNADLNEARSLMATVTAAS